MYLRSMLAKITFQTKIKRDNRHGHCINCIIEVKQTIQMNTPKETSIFSSELVPSPSATAEYFLSSLAAAFSLDNHFSISRLLAVITDYT